MPFFFFISLKALRKSSVKINITFPTFIIQFKTSEGCNLMHFMIKEKRLTRLGWNLTRKDLSLFIVAQC